MNDTDQLVSWVMGESKHSKDGTCCPDFSCCLAHEKRLKVDGPLRARYLKAFAEDDHHTMYKIKTMFYTEFNLPNVMIFELDHQTWQ